MVTMGISPASRTADEPRQLVLVIEKVVPARRLPNICSGAGMLATAMEPQAHESEHPSIGPPTPSVSPPHALSSYSLPAPRFPFPPGSLSGPAH